MKSTVQQLHHRQRLPFLTGLATAILATQIVVTWTLICGTSLPSIISLSAAGALGCLAASLLRSPASLRLQIVFAAMVAATSWLYTYVLDATLTVGSNLMPAVAVIGFLPPGLFAACVIAMLLTWSRSLEFTGSNSAGPTMIGLASGLFCMLLHGVVAMPMAVTSSLAILACVFAKRFHITSTEPREAVLPKITATSWIGLIGVGILSSVTLRWTSFFFPLTADVLCLGAAIAFSVAGGILLTRFRGGIRRPAVAFICLLFVIGIPLMTAPLVEWNLWWNAAQYPASLVTIVRATQVSLCLLSLFGILVVMPATDLRIQDMRRPAALLVGFVAALVAMQVSIRLAIGLGAGLSALAMFMRNRIEDNTASTSARSGWLRIYGQPLIATSLASFAAVMLPTGAAEQTKLLFTLRSSVGYQLGIATDLIRQSDSTRLLAEAEGRDGQLTVWRTSGDRLEICRNGIRTAQATSNVFTSPQPIADSLVTVLPLIFHSNPHNVMLIGDDAGIGLNACCSFPVQRIVAVRTDAATTDIAKRIVWGTADASPFEDPRVTITCQPPGLVVRQQTAAPVWDVIVANMATAAAPAAQDQFTTEFYSAVSRQLKADGVFCQRIVQHGIGAQPLVRMISSAIGVFERLVLIRTDVGEIAMVAGNSNLLDEGLLARMEKSHVGREIARSGWDWSQVAALPVVDTADPVGFMEHTQLLTEADATNGFFAFSLGRESLRLADKSAEIRDAFAPHQQRLADAAPQSASYAEFARRYSSVVQQSEILTAFPDHPWPYRNSLRSEMQRNPRQAVEHVRNGKISRTPHPLDELRKGYFLKLGEAIQQAKSGSVDPRVLKELADYTLVNEPLLSHFAHHELVKIHEATGHPSPAIELRHRLHTVYYSEPVDLSIRQVIVAMNQLLADPGLLASDSIRFDHVNSMLQELVQRWEGRRGVDPSSARRTQRDVDDSVRVANRALDAMEAWAQSVNRTSEDIRLRRKFVNIALISPLREYRDQVLAHRIRTEAPEEAIADESGDLPLLATPDSLTTN